MIDSASIERAAAIIRRGGLVAFPTETVYGLGANALDAAAVRKIYAAKDRPFTSPLIVHVDSVEMAMSLAAGWPESAAKLAGAFWPGPLTMVLPKGSKVPFEVTAGLPTVGIRMPSHPVALQLIRAAGVPIAAPSANPFTRLSPTTAGHVRKGLGKAVDLILDAGPAQVGIESTVLSLAQAQPVLLRPGIISRAALERVIGLVTENSAPPAGEGHLSPGLHLKHYSPRSPLVLWRQGAPMPEGRGVLLWITAAAEGATKSIRMPANPVEYAAGLYGTLHGLDDEFWDWIAVEAPPEGQEWDGIRDRLTRAAHSKN
jgi:L-threonylcarbamoyladenylate synthase